MKGRCVICNAVGPLTRDHVPPRGAVPPGPIEIRRLTAAIDPASESDERRVRGFQAPTFPSLCAVCNGARLGSTYDPALIQFASRLAAWVRGTAQLGLSLPEVAPLEVNAGAVARSVVGHLLAAEERQSPTAPLSDGSLLGEMRAFFLDSRPHTPPFRIFVWPYPASEIVIVRGFALSRVLGRTHGPVVGDVLKFFPLAFWVVGHADPGISFPFVELPLSGVGLTRIEVPMRGIPSPKWPELPGKQEVVALNAERTHVASMRPPKAT